MRVLNDLLDGLPPLLVYAVVGALVFGEVAVTAGLVLPAATALILMGLLANAGTVSIVPALAVAVGAAWLGGTVAYRSGRRLGARARTTRLGKWIGPKRWDRADRLFIRYGGRAVFLGQWVVVARTLIPRLAGMNGVSYRRFAAWHTPAAGLWAAWMVGVSFALGASYDRLASQVGHASGALAVLTGMIVALVLAGRWIGRHPEPVRALARRITPRWSWRRRVERSRPLLGLGIDATLSVAALSLVAVLVIVVTPIVVRFSGLAELDVSIATWARSEWSSDGYLFALGAATSANPEGLLAIAAGVALVRWWWTLRAPAGAGFVKAKPANPALPSGQRGTVGVLGALAPVVPVGLFAVLLDALMPKVPRERAFAPDGWRAPADVVFPSVEEFGGQLPSSDALGALASMAASDTAVLTAAVGLLAWLVARRLRWSLRVAVWTAAALYVAVSAGSWVYLGWSRASETIAAIVLGVAWTALNATIWSTHDAPASTDVPVPDLLERRAVDRGGVQVAAHE